MLHPVPGSVSSPVARIAGCAGSLLTGASAANGGRAERRHAEMGITMAEDNKQTLYEILGVSPQATLGEIKAAHRARSLELVSGQTGLSREEVNFQLQVLDLALTTLSASWSRDAYDAELAARAPASGHNLALVPVSPTAVHTPAFNAVEVADALHQSYKTALAGSDTGHQLAVFAESASASVSALKKIFRLLAWLLIASVLLKGCLSMYAASHPPIDPYAKEKAWADDKLAIQDYYQKHGIHVASRAEAQMLLSRDAEEEGRRRAAEMEKQRQEQQSAQFAEMGRREGERVARDLAYADAQARAEEEREKREAEWKKQQEEERQRAEEERARMAGYERARRDEALARQRAHAGQWRQPAY